VLGRDTDPFTNSNSGHSYSNTANHTYAAAGHTYSDSASSNPDA
jgi:hypothetical protein